MGKIFGLIEFRLLEKAFPNQTFTMLHPGKTLLQVLKTPPRQKEVTHTLMASFCSGKLFLPAKGRKVTVLEKR